jgi:hypothetical protein
MDIPQFNHLPVERHMGGFQFLAVVNKAAMNIRIEVFL